MKPFLQVGIIAGENIGDFEHNSKSLLVDLNSNSDFLESTIVLVDDSGFLARDLSEIFPLESLGKVQLKVVKHSEARGRPIARNSVLENIEIGQGKFLTWLDVDDIWMAGRTSQILDFIQSHQDMRAVQVVGFETDWGKGKRKLTMPSRYFGDYSAIFSGYTPCYLWSMTFNTELIRHLRFDEKLPRLQDLDFVLQAKRLGAYFSKYSGQPTIKYCKTDSHVNCFELDLCYSYVLEKHTLEFQRLSRRQQLAAEVNKQQLIRRCMSGRTKESIFSRLYWWLSPKKFELNLRAAFTSLISLAGSIFAHSWSSIRRMPSHFKLLRRM